MGIFRFASTVAVTTMTLFAGSASAAVVIDDFSASHRVGKIATGTTSSTTVAANVPGGQRRLLTQTFSGSGTTQAEIVGGRYRVDRTAADSTVFADVIYRGDVFNGFSVDASEGGANDRFSVQVSGNGSFQLNMFVRTGEGISEWNINVEAGEQRVEMLFDSADLRGTFLSQQNFANVSDIVFGVWFRGGDTATSVTVGGIRAVPAPAGIGLLAGLGLAASRRRR